MTVPLFSKVCHHHWSIYCLCPWQLLKVGRVTNSSRNINRTNLPYQDHRENTEQVAPMQQKLNSWQEERKATYQQLCWTCFVQKQKINLVAVMLGLSLCQLTSFANVAYIILYYYPKLTSIRAWFWTQIGSGFYIYLASHMSTRAQLFTQGDISYLNKTMVNRYIGIKAIWGSIKRIYCPKASDRQQVSQVW